MKIFWDFPKKWFLWIYDVIMTSKFAHFFPFFNLIFEFLTLIITRTVKINYPILFEIFRELWTFYWDFPKMSFSWTYDVIMTSQFAHFFPFFNLNFEFLTLIITRTVKMNYPILLEIFRDLWKCHWDFPKMWFSWTYDVIMTSMFANYFPIFNLIFEFLTLLITRTVKMNYPILFEIF